MRGNIKRLSSRLVLKSTPLYWSRVEAEATCFIAEQCPSIPVPRLHHYWEEGDEGHLLMDYVEGEPFQRARHQLSSAQCETIMKQLARYVENLRRIPQPPPLTRDLPERNWIGSPLGHAMTDFSMTQMDDPFGPFASQNDFNDWKVSRYKRSGDVHPPTAQRIVEMRDAMPDDHSVVFTHGDINRKNVLLRVTGDGQEDVDVTAPLDWEQAGWRPVWWSPCSAISKDVRPLKGEAGRSYIDNETECTAPTTSTVSTALQCIIARSKK
ncbi:kinase-like domain-containing protein [Ganoderma leucocontextum]|nr:kinase-like domain-containing protein [Ganoderma leucocontextum]